MSIRPCGHAARGAKPCTIALTTSGLCLYHGTAEDRQEDLDEAEREAQAARDEAVAAHRANTLAVRQTLLAQEKRRNRRFAAAGVALTLVVGWFSWQQVAEQRHDQSCNAVRAASASARQDARAVAIPLTPRTDGAIPGRWPDTEEGVKAAYEHKRGLEMKFAAIVLGDVSCFSGAQLNEAHELETLPRFVAWVAMPAPAHCADGWSSPSIGRQGACSHHGGVVPARIYAELRFAPV